MKHKLICSIIVIVITIVIYSYNIRGGTILNLRNRDRLKMAICFFGITRSLAYTHHSIKTNILDELDKNNIDYDIYIHTYYLDNINNPRSGEFNLPLNNREFELLFPYIHKIDDQDKFDRITNYNTYFNMGDMKDINDNYKSFKNFIRALNSKKELTNLWVNSNKQYDVVLYLRPDLLYDKINANQFFKIKNKRNSIFIPTWANWEGYNDRLACGTPYVMSKWGTALWDNILLYSNNHQVNSECYNKYIIDSLNFKRKKLYIIGKRVRANGEIQGIDQHLF